MSVVGSTNPPDPEQPREEGITEEMILAAVPFYPCPDDLLDEKKSIIRAMLEAALVVKSRHDILPSCQAEFEEIETSRQKINMP